MLLSNSQQIADCAFPWPRDLSQMPKVAALRRVLVVDDEPLIRWSVAETLGDRGYAVIEAGSGQDALRALSASKVPFDVVVLDLRLPDSNDLRLLSRIRAWHPELAVILMTAYGTSEIVQGALALGAFRVITKPFEMTELAELVSMAHDPGRR
jgi:two-component system response regulator AtoC